MFNGLVLMGLWYGWLLYLMLCVLAVAANKWVKKVTENERTFKPKLVYGWWGNYDHYKFDYRDVLVGITAIFVILGSSCLLAATIDNDTAFIRDVLTFPYTCGPIMFAVYPFLIYFGSISFGQKMYKLYTKVNKKLVD